MYSFLVGVVEEKDDNLIGLNVNGVGYEVLVSSFTANELKIGEVAKIYTYLHVREDDMSLFGFLTKREKVIFTELISVSGVGAKTAIQILSGVPQNDLVTAIVSGDTTLISGIKGIGKKTAERIILELHSKFGDVSLPMDTMLGGNLGGVFEDAISVLVGMGLTRVDAQVLVKQVALEGDKVEDIVTKALRNMG